ncbi:hypothetical protein [Litchfieldia alkalitelluris]|uniref:hypothetical protein n=1 Tax=Litchfieldia alkalitelluris TaxID=304268 RepID=UPI0009975C27|nr:hypothetical protein [Litchfieldia alkalitelluris]
MSLKLIELQVAIPRTQDFGKITEQLNQRGQILQNQLATEQKKLDQVKRKQVSAKSKSDSTVLQQGNASLPSAVLQESIIKQQSQFHPTKGKMIDIIG